MLMGVTLMVMAFMVVAVVIVMVMIAVVGIDGFEGGFGFNYGGGFDRF